MAIDDNTSYELTGYQVKDLAQKIRAKADSSSLASVATSGLYSDLTGAPTIPTVYNGTLTIQQNGTQLGTFSANQSSNEIINITTGGGASVVPVILTLDTPSAGSFSTDETFANIIAADIVQIFEGTYVYSVVGYSDSIQQKTLYISADGTSIYKLDYTSSSATSGTYTKFESQEKLTAGTNITIAADGKTISATDTTYSNFIGATSSVAGAAGLVPAPTTSDPDKFLKGDGTWAAVSSGGMVVSLTLSNGRFTSTETFADITSTYSAGNIVLFEVSGKTATIFSTDNYSKIYLDYGAIDKLELEFDGPSATVGSYSVVMLVDQTTLQTDLAQKQNNLTAGMFINIDNTDPANPVISSQDTVYSAGTNINIDTTDPDNPVISATDTTYSNFTGATSSVAGAAGLVPAPAAGDEAKALHGDGTWKDTTAKLVEMSYGESNAWAKFIAAYQAGSIVYCRASSNANPGTGSQTRKAFMAYVNDAANPTSVEFQYVRSVSSKTSSQPVDQVFVYTLKNTSGGTWSVATRDMAPKIAAGTGINVSYSNGTYTISLAS